MTHSKLGHRRFRPVIKICPAGTRLHSFLVPHLFELFKAFVSVVYNFMWLTGNRGRQEEKNVDYGLAVWAVMAKVDRGPRVLMQRAEGGKRGL